MIVVDISNMLLYDAYFSASKVSMPTNKPKQPLTAVSIQVPLNMTGDENRLLTACARTRTQGFQVGVEVVIDSRRSMHSCGAISLLQIPSETSVTCASLPISNPCGHRTSSVSGAKSPKLIIMIPGTKKKEARMFSD